MPSQSIWSLVTIVGPTLLIAAIIFVTVRNRLKSTPQSEAMTERATKIQREAEAAEPKDVDGPLG
jgi:F0F1-type ATP synthase membrane subunit b/b'